MEQAAATVLEAMAANRPLVPLAAALFAAAETFLFLSILIPATAILVGAGALVAAEAFPFLPLWAGAAAGAMVGSTLSWWIGRRWGDRILALWPLRSRPELVERGRAAFERHGGAAILMGHFLGALRPVAFVFAGMSAIGFWRFQAWNAAGALAWAFVVPKTGVVGGDLIGWIRLFLGI